MRTLFFNYFYQIIIFLNQSIEETFDKDFWLGGDSIKCWYKNKILLNSIKNRWNIFIYIWFCCFSILRVQKLIQLEFCFFAMNLASCIFSVFAYLLGFCSAYFYKRNNRSKFRVDPVSKPMTNLLIQTSLKIKHLKEPTIINITTEFFVNV